MRPKRSKAEIPSTPPQGGFLFWGCPLSADTRHLDFRPAALPNGNGPLLYGFYELTQSRLPSKQQLRFNLRLIVQNHVQQGTVDFNVAVVIDKAQLPKLVHEKTDARSRRADHLGERLLTDLR